MSPLKGAGGPADRARLAASNIRAANAARERALAVLSPSRQLGRQQLAAVEEQQPRTEPEPGSSRLVLSSK